MTDETPEKKRPNWRRVAKLTAGSIAALALIWLVIWVLIWGVWGFEHDRIYTTDKNGNETLVQAAGIIVTGFCTSVIALIALIALIAGIFTLIGLHYTGKKHALELQQFQHAQEQFAESQKQFGTTLCRGPATQGPTGFRPVTAPHERAGPPKGKPAGVLTCPHTTSSHRERPFRSRPYHRSRQPSRSGERRHREHDRHCPSKPAPGRNAYPLPTRTGEQGTPGSAHRVGGQAPQ
jgi:hypothetical protein